jgi:cyclohexanecarboxyl-CoA dehydrogenase
MKNVMNFDFTEEQQLFGQRLREGVERLITPGYMERWPKDEFNKPGLKDLKKLGLLGFDFPEKYGGQGFMLSAVNQGIAVYELGRGDLSLATIWGGSLECSQVLMALASDEVLDEWAPDLVNGDKFVGYCFTEPGIGTNLGAIKTTAVEDGDYWVINGSKSSVSFAFADAHIVAARTSNAPGAYGITLFLVPSDLEGVQKSVYTDFGLKNLGRGDVNYKNVRIPKKYLLGEREGGFKNIMHIFDAGRPTIALECIGAAETVVEKCIEYCKQREVFGQPLAKYEAISFGLAEHVTNLEIGKMLAFKALWIRDENRWNAKEAAQAKFFGCNAAIEAIWFCARAFGHLGYTSEYFALNKMADCMGFAWGDGSWEACKMVAIREIAGDEFLPYTRAKRQKA